MRKAVKLHGRILLPLLLSWLLATNVSCQSLLQPSTALQLVQSKRGNLVVAMLKSGTFESSRELLFEAAIFNQSQVVRCILEDGFDVDSHDPQGKTVLWMCQTPEVLSEVLKFNPSLDLEAEGETALQSYLYGNVWPPWALGDLNRAKAELLVKAGASLDLNSAILLHRKDFAVNYLKQHPESAHEHDDFVPLRLAAVCGNLEFCKYLVENFDVDVDDFDRGNGLPILTEALMYPQVVQLLIDHGADLERRVTWLGGRSGIFVIGDEATCLHRAARDGTRETIEILLDSGIDVFAAAQDPYDEEAEATQTALEVAAIFGKTRNALAILEHPAFAAGNAALRKKALDVSLLACSRSHWANRSEEDRSELLEALFAQGAGMDPNARGPSVVQLAVRGIHPSMRTRMNSFESKCRYCENMVQS